MPFSSLSSDNLLNIFMMMLREENYRPTEYPIAVRLSQIAPCTRYVVRNAPLLWTRIDPLVILHPTCLKLHLELSRQCPLDIWIANTDVLNKDCDGQYPHLIPLLAHAHRWRSLTIWADTNNDIEQLQTIFEDLRAQNLEELHMFCKNSDGEDIIFANSPGYIFQGGAPRLNTITLDRATLFPSATPNLTRLNLTNEIRGDPIWDYSEFAEMLSDMPSLTSISMTGPVVGIDDGTVFDDLLEMAVTLPNLRSVTLFMDQVEECIYVCDAEGEKHTYLAAIVALFASAPLQCLFIKGPFSIHIPLILECMHSKVLCFPHVTELDLNGVDLSTRPSNVWSQQEAVTFIQAFPSVGRVCLHFEATAILDALIGAPDAGDLWRQLQVMFIRDPGSTLPSVQKLAESRIGAGRPLQELWLRDFGKRPTDVSLDWLEGHVEVKWISLDKCREMFHVSD